MKLPLSLALFVALVFGLAAQDIQIRVVGDKFSFDEQPEGALVLPKKKGQPSEVLRGPVPAKSADGSVAYVPGGSGYTGIWSVEKSRPGRYDFYLAARRSGAEYKWSPKIKVELSMGGVVKTFVPPAGTGAVWYVFSIAGGADVLQEAGLLLPQGRLLYGVVRDAATGKALSGASVKLAAPPGNAVVANTVTDADGTYFLVAPDGMRFTLEFTAPDRIPVREKIDYLKEDYPRRIDTALTGKLKNSQYRFVLTWGQRPSDLDAHLVGPDLTGKEFHISYHNMRSWSGRHFLDVDDMDSFGPETITLNRLDDGVYEFFVHDFSNGFNPQSGGLAASDAMVRLYREQELLAEFTVPADMAGTVWKVCTLNGQTGELIPGDVIVP